MNTLRVFKTVVALSIFATGIFLFMFMNFARAAIGTNTTAGLVTQSQTIKASSLPTAVIGLNLAAAPETLSSILLSINPTAGFATSTDLASLGVATSSGGRGCARATGHRRS